MRTLPLLRTLLLILIGIGLLSSSRWVLAEGLNLYVQPIASEAKTKAMFQPLADYLSKQTGIPITVHTEPNFLAYWERMRQPAGFDLVIDAAHFTDYRDVHYRYHVLAKYPHTVSFSLITSHKLMVLDAQELIGKSLATAASPSLGGVRVAELFPNPVRQPTLVAVDDFRGALEKLRRGEVNAAMVPTPMLRFYNNVNTIMTTKPVPHMAFSASPNVSLRVQKLLRNAILAVGKSEAGKQVLKPLHIPSFQPADNTMYRGYAKLLDGIWGY